ncbi:MAG TPA: GxGYxYP domain-containing protein [Chthonomonadaceae bacterium]|nr:GxGYxYP domain-containing protein [Chthonomonadaceae bacterium]
MAVKVWQAEGPEAAHKIGRSVADSQANGGKAWEARVGIDLSSQTMLYGPYAEIPAGDYVAFFRMKLLDEAGEEPVAEIDAASSYGQDILNTRPLTGSDLMLGRYVEIPLAFHHPGGKLECRVTWRGYSGLRVDQVSLLRLTSGSLTISIRRAEPAVPSGLPKDLPYVPTPRRTDLFPRSAPPASTLSVFDLSRQPPDEQLMLFSLQGLVNRTRPQLYVLFNPTDAQWLAWMRKRGWVRHTQTVASPEALLTRFHSDYRGVIVTDPQLPATKNVATMLAGVENGLVVSPRLEKQLRLPVLADLRGRWYTNVAAYQWAFDHLWPRLSHAVIACSYPDHLGLRDYLVENKVFIFWLSGPIDGARPYADPQAEVRLMERLFARMPANIPVMSYPWAGKDVGIGEGPGVTLFAEFGKFLVGSIDCTNLSVHSGIRLASLKQHAAPPPPALQPNKIYVSFVISDGDNLPVLTASNYPQLWTNRVRGRFPVGWTVSPSASMLIPDIVDYYYATATPNDTFLGAVSGIGYTYPDSYGLRYRASDRPRVFDGFLDLTRAYMDRMDLKDLWVMNVTRPELFRLYAERIPSLQALFPDYGRRVADYEDATYPTARRVPVFHALTNWADGLPRDQQIASVVSQIRALTPPTRPAFLHLFVLNWFADLPMLQEILSRLGPDYVPVRPDHLATLYREELAKERVLVRAPSDVSGIEGQPIAFTAHVQNVTSAPMAVHVSVTGGLQEAHVLPASAHLAPGQDTDIQIDGLPTGKRIALAIEGPFGVRHQAVSLHAIDRQEIAGPMPSGLSLRFTRQFAAVELAHRFGQAEPDAPAGGHLVWAALREKTEPGWIVYGPYLPLPPGRYLALFRLKRIGDGAGPVATIDACTGGGTNILARLDLSADDLPQGDYRAFPLLFDHPGGEIETRVNWTGNASLLVDSITLWKVETATQK